MVDFFERLIGALLGGGILFASGYILRHWIADLYNRKPYNKKDIENVCNKLTDFERLSLSVQFMDKVDWNNIRPEEKKDFFKYIETIKTKAKK